MILTGSRPAQTQPAAHFLWKRNVKEKIKVDAKNLLTLKRYSAIY